MKDQRLVTRRGFLKGTAAVGSALALPAIVPSSVFGANAPSNRIVMGAIGVGSQGCRRRDQPPVSVGAIVLVRERTLAREGHPLARRADNPVELTERACGGGRFRWWGELTAGRGG